jgi:polyisoprenyl-teichoic acid--peptidoglycan teichoic acid transferase
MPSARDTWRALSPVSRAVAVVGLVVAIAAVGAIVVLAAALPRPETASGPSHAPTEPPPLPPTATPAPSTTPAPTATPPPGTADPLLGTDGRLTVLLLGSDYRPAKPGNRTDAIMIVSVDPTTGKSAGFSIPRDVSNFPLPDKGTFGPKVNGLYAYLESHGGKAGARMKQAVGRAFGIEIDNYVFMGFSGVKAYVRAVGGVDVTLDKPYYDPFYWVNNHHQGWGLPAGKSHLNDDQALIFARSRKGDSDFGRARRQQQLVLAALAKVDKLGLAQLPQLVRIAGRFVRTDIPVSRAGDLLRLLSAVDLSHVDRAVFGPKTFAAKGAGTNYILRLNECKAWIAKHFPAIRPLGGWPPAAATGSAAPSASPAASPSGP